MKLCSLYIENFGCLSGFALDFEEGLTTLSRPNGFGKTTLAEFIRAMFYGFPRRTKTLEKSKRQKYTPWSGGKCGGNLVFEQEGQRFRIERTFGATPKTDTFVLIDLATNRKTNRYSAEIGMELFGLDSDSFERSVYLPQLQEDGVLSTSAIQAKLTNLVEDSGDVGNYDNAIALLRAKRSALIPYRGNGGAVAEAAAQITGLQLQLDQAQNQYDRLTQLQRSAACTEQKLEHTKRELAQLQQKLAAASEAAAQLVQRDRYLRMKQEQQRIEAQISAVQAGYSPDFPEISELSAMEAAADKLAALENQIISLNVPQQVPTQDALDACRKECEALAVQQQELRAAESDLAVQMQKTRESPAVPPEKTGAAAVVLVWILSAVGIVASAVLITAKQVLFGSIGLGIGVLAMFAACLRMWHRKKNLRAQAAQKKQETDRCLAAAQQRVTELRRDCQQRSSEIARFLADCGMEVPPQQFLTGLARLEHRLQLAGQAQQREAERAAYRAQLAAFFERCGLAFCGDLRVRLRQMRDDLREMQALTVRKQELAGAMEQLVRAYPEILSMSAAAAEDVQPLRKQEQHLRDTYINLTETLLQQKQELQYLQTQTERLPALREELAQLQQQMTEDREKVRILDETMDFLKQARERLSTSYLDTIRGRFGWYMAQLENASGEKYLIDTDFQVYPERMGQMRELAYFSAGQTDLVMLCMRLALVDALFREESMFVILDDPFVNLDDTHTAQGCALLRNLAAKRQILYLTCHSSRHI